MRDTLGNFGHTPNVMRNRTRGDFGTAGVVTPISDFRGYKVRATLGDSTSGSSSSASGPNTLQSIVSLAQVGAQVVDTLTPSTSVVTKVVTAPGTATSSTTYLLAATVLAAGFYFYLDHLSKK